MNLRKQLKSIFAAAGYVLTKKSAHMIQDENYMRAIQPFLKDQATFFDIGANRGQTTEKYLNFFGNQVTIHAFEPSNVCFAILKETARNHKNVVVNQQGMGQVRGNTTFNEYDWSELNSFNTRKSGSSKISSTYEVFVNTVDQYCADQKIDHIDLLKTDTEGFELSVLKGAEKMLTDKKIKFIHIECFFRNDYQEEMSFGDIYNYLIGKEYYLVRFYPFEYTTEGLAYRTDALFAKKQYSDN